MKYLKQAMVILLFSVLGEVLHALVPAPVPASIYGMVLLFAALALKLVKLEQVREMGQFLVSIMTVMFVSPAVGLLLCWDVVRQALVPICVITVVSLVVTFFVSGKVTQLLMGRKEKDHG